MKAKTAQLQGNHHSTHSMSSSSVYTDLDVATIQPKILKALEQLRMNILLLKSGMELAEDDVMEDELDQQLRGYILQLSDDEEVTGRTVQKELDNLEDAISLTLTRLHSHQA